MIRCAYCGTSQRLFLYAWHLTGRRLPCIEGHDHDHQVVEVAT